MQVAVLYGPRDLRFEQRENSKIVKPTDAIIRMSATCVCGSDLWPYRGVNPTPEPTPFGHEYCGVVEEVGSAVKSVKPGQFVIGSFAAFDNTCPNCLAGYTTSCVQREWGHSKRTSNARCNDERVATGPTAPDRGNGRPSRLAIPRRHEGTGVRGEGRIL
jgi:threonine dehydrogenase-like Zn-dependent dehydrogenase